MWVVNGTNFIFATPMFAWNAGVGHCLTLYTSLLRSNCSKWCNCWLDGRRSFSGFICAPKGVCLHSQSSDDCPGVKMGKHPLRVYADRPVENQHGSQLNFQLNTLRPVPVSNPARLGSATQSTSHLYSVIHLNYTKSWIKVSVFFSESSIFVGEFRAVCHGAIP